MTSDKERPDAIRFYEGLGFVASHEGMKLHLQEPPKRKLRRLKIYEAASRTSMLLLIKNILFTVFVPGIVAVYVPLRMAGFRFKTFAEWGLPQIAALLPVLLGAAIYFWCLWDFATFGLGTPAPIDAPRRLVVRGLYRFVRNPMYVGVLLVILGWALFFESQAILLYGAAVGLGFHLFVLLVEEPMLTSRFGDSYETYRRKVRRWIPGRRW